MNRSCEISPVFTRREALSDLDFASSICARPDGWTECFGADIFLRRIEAEASQGLRKCGLAAVERKIQLLLVQFGDDLAFSNVLAEIDQDRSKRVRALRR